MTTAAQQRVYDLAVIYKKHFPESKTLVEAAEKVRDAQLQPGENAGLQVLYCFDGKETSEDHINWDAQRKPYGDDGNLGWDHKMDCSEFTRRSILFATGCRVDIGTWTMGQLAFFKKHGWPVPFAERRPFDVILFDFKHRGASHAALDVEDPNIMHTTSPGDPLRIQNASYGAANRVGVWRVLTDEEYNALIIPAIVVPQPPVIEKPKVYQYIGASFVNLREAASTKSKAVCRVCHGMEVEYVRDVTAAKHTWWMVRSGAKVGYVYYTGPKYFKEVNK